MYVFYLPRPFHFADKHKHDQDGHVHHHHNHDPVPVNKQVPSALATKLPNRKVPLHKEFACTNLACTNPHCSDVMCGTQVTEIKNHNSDPDLYSSRYALDTAVAHSKFSAQAYISFLTIFTM